jgi:hypothetical protein
MKEGEQNGDLAPSRGTDVALHPCTPSAAVLCLESDEFQHQAN